MGINWVTFFAQIVNLFVLVWLLKKFLYRPILEAVEKRQNEIRNKVKKATDEQALAEQAHQELLKQQALFESQKAKKFEAAIREIDSYKQTQFDDIKNQTEQMRQKMQADLNRETKQLNLQIRDMMAAAFVSLSQKIMADLSGETPLEQSLTLFKRKIKSLQKSDINKIKSSYKNESIILINSSDTLNKKMRENLAVFLSDTFGWKLPLHMRFEQDKNLIFGFEMTIDDISVEWNLKSYLDDYQTNLTDTLAGLIVKE
ncbi:MAG: hypothetical protein ACI4QM_03900 [Alphaproteobacteria bacterium]